MLRPYAEHKMTLPEKLQEIVDDFCWASREEKVEMLIQYAESLPPLPERLQSERDKMDPVPECMTPSSCSAKKMRTAVSPSTSTSRPSRPLCEGWQRFWPRD